MTSNCKSSKEQENSNSGKPSLQCVEPTSPLESLPKIGSLLGIELRAKRDDLITAFGGGNKARKIARIAQEYGEVGYNAIVTNGGTQSNHARVVAMWAAKKGWRCRLILHGEEENLLSPKGNLLLMRLAGAEIEIVRAEEIGTKIREAMEKFIAEGYNPLEIQGGGHCIEGSLAYFNAVQELRRQCDQDGWKPDYIILASGTGTTQAGIVVGVEMVGWETRVIGISVARKNPRGEEIVRQSASDLREHLKLWLPARVKIEFRDGWVGEGYQKANRKVIQTILFAGKEEALLLDPTYTGKAFTGLVDLVAAGEIPKGSKVLFWHTGGLLNLAASSYFEGKWTCP
jgi:D-cysteine desulfhydrase